MYRPLPQSQELSELKDLRTIVSNSSYFKMPDHVRVLSNKLVNGDAANAKYDGKSLGNLYAGSSGDHMEKLVGKWFLGSDRPVSDQPETKEKFKYEKANGSLFQNGVSYQDINQGYLNDCYFLAGLGEVAFRSPQTIQNMFIDNGNSTNTYTVRFYVNGVADYVTVDKYLPVDKSGNFVYAQPGQFNKKHFTDPNNELWVALAEKAYAQWNESGKIVRDNTNSYKGIEFGWDREVVKHITGRNSTRSTSFDFNTMVSAFNSGSLMGVSSNPNASQIDPKSRIAANHVYVVVGYNSSTQKFKLFNPWGMNDDVAGYNVGTFDISFNELKANFSGWSRTT
ncbi:C2 family cysteine protease [Scytonema sp. UIC 10036]|uniref:C2 family cysteine protease n=1 Tax=Scytonema sp. UIC 10036 TaxID=2304196 RepID=UPI001FA9D731|nr:C2 family cysteine protease [Scytonema sp. UIC 10036]